MEHQVVLVTGANNGIEPGLVRSLLPRGWRVAALDLSGENLVGLGTPATLRLLACDVTDPAAVERAVAAVIAGSMSWSTTPAWRTSLLLKRSPWSTPGASSR